MWTEYLGDKEYKNIYEYAKKYGDLGKEIFLRQKKFFSVLSIIIFFKKNKDVSYENNSYEYILYMPKFEFDECISTKNLSFTDKEETKKLCNIIPSSWQILYNRNQINLMPNYFYKDIFRDYIHGESELEYSKNTKHSEERIESEGARALAFSCGKNMRGYFAEELLEYFEEKPYNPGEFSQWAKDYDVNFLKLMYEKEIDPDVTWMLQELQLCDWNEDLAVSPENIKKILKEWIDQGTIRPFHQHTKPIPNDLVFPQEEPVVLEKVNS